ncbi:cyclic pyranopterin monophosphate synthase [Argonauta hians]
MMQNSFRCYQLQPLQKCFHPAAKLSGEHIWKYIKPTRLYHSLLMKYSPKSVTSKSSLRILTPLPGYFSDSFICFTEKVRRLLYTNIIKNKLQANESSFSHVNVAGKINMVDVGEKSVTQRCARATGVIYIGETALKLLKEDELKKGSALVVADIAGIMAAKKTSDFIPLCHNIPVTKAELTFQINDSKHCVQVTSEIHTVAQTGVEMEALMAVSVSLLTIYDMCKAVDKNMLISDIQLVSKTGGKTDFKASCDGKKNVA